MFIRCSRDRREMARLTRSMIIRRSRCRILVVSGFKTSHDSSWSSLNATARWWFSSTDSSLYINASSEPDARQHLALLPWSRYSNQTGERVCLGVWTITFELNDLRPEYLARWFSLTIQRSNPQLKVTGKSLWSREGKCCYSGQGDLEWGFLVLLTSIKLFTITIK